MVNVNGREKMASLLLHTTVLLTFGLSSTMLGVAITIAIVSDCLISRLVVGLQIDVLNANLAKSHLTDNSSDVMDNPLQTQQEQRFSCSDDGSEFKNHVEPVYLAHQVDDTASTVLREKKRSVQSHIRTTQKEPRLAHGNEKDGHKNDDEAAPQTGEIVSSNLQDLLQSHVDKKSQMYHTGRNLDLILDVRDAWCGIFACSSIVIGTVSLYWALIFFDAIADVYSVESGMFTSICMGVGLPLLEMVLSKAMPEVSRYYTSLSELPLSILSGYRLDSEGCNS